MPDKKCPNCGLWNAESALECDCGYDFTIKQIKESAVVGKKFGIRAGAYIIDTLLCFLLSYAAGLVSGVMLGIVLIVSGRTFPIDWHAMWMPYCLGGLVLFVLYFAIFEWLYGATLGKLILGMRVVQENGDPCSFKSAFIRGLFRYIDLFPFAIPAYTTMEPPFYQRIGDKAAKTIVVGSNDPVIRQPRAWWWFLVAAVVYFAFNILILIATLVVSVAVC